MAAVTAGLNPSRKANVILLVLAYGAAQGAMLLAQTALIFLGAWDLVGLFGLAFTFATLAYLLVDLGGGVLLARVELSDVGEEEATAFFSSFCIVRMAVALLGVGAIACWANLAAGEFAAAYATAAAPALLLGAVNPAGRLDGLHRSGATGLTSMAPTLLSALALPASTAVSGAHQPYLLGGAFALGTAISVALQFAAIARAGRTRFFGRPSLGRIKLAAREGALIMANPLPSWLFARAEVAVSMSVLGAAATGLFVYAKQVANAAQQLTYLIRRAELPALMSLDRASVRGAFQAQRISILVGIVVGIAMSAFGLLLWRVAPPLVSAPMLVVAAFGPVVVVAICYAALNQMYVAYGRTLVATLVGCAFLPAFFVAVPAVTRFGIFGLALIELVINSFALSVLILIRARTLGGAPPGESGSA